MMKEHLEICATMMEWSETKTGWFYVYGSPDECASFRQNLSKRFNGVAEMTPQGEGMDAAAELIDRVLDKSPEEKASIIWVDFTKASLKGTVFPFLNLLNVRRAKLENIEKFFIFSFPAENPAGIRAAAYDIFVKRQAGFILSGP